MVLSVIKGLGKAYLKGKGKKLLGSKSVDVWKSKAAKAKLDAAKFNLKKTFEKSDEVLKKFKTTVKKQKKILDD